MQEIQLYLQNDSGGYDRVEMFQDETITITESIKNAKDIAKVFTTFTRQFTVPASKINNKLFSHYYNYDITNGFDARLRRDAKIEINYLPYKLGKLKLDGVDMRSNKPFAYRVTFYGSIVELKDIVGEDKLYMLDALDFSKPYSDSAILSALRNPPDADGCLIPLITHSQRLYYDSLNPSEQSGNMHYDGVTKQGVKFDQLKYAIKLNKIIDAIEAQYPEIQFAPDSFFKDGLSEIFKLYMWCHRKSGAVEVASGDMQQVTFPDAEIDFGSFSTVGNKFYVDTPYFVDIEIDFSPSQTDALYNIIVHKNGELLYRVDNRTGYTTIDVTSETSYVPAPNNDYFEVYIESYEKDVEFDFIQWDVQYRQDADPQSPILNDQIQSDLLVYNAGYAFNIGRNLPEQTIIEFLSSLFKMFNLVAYVQEDGYIQVETLDSYYKNTEHDISKYIDITKSNVDAALIHKEIFFKYSDTETILAKQHLKELSDVEWGGVEYTEPGNLDGTIYKVEPKFHHAKYEKLLDYADNADTGTQYGYFVDESESAYAGDPLIMYVNYFSPYRDLGFLGREDLISMTQYGYINMPSNTEIIDDETSQSIHFSEEFSEFTTLLAEDSLFNRYYKNYIQNIFNPTTRIVKVNAVLPVSMIISIKPSDVITINNRQYRINSMVIGLKDGRTQLELLNGYSLDTATWAESNVLFYSNDNTWT